MSALHRLGISQTDVENIKANLSEAQKQTSSTFAYKWRQRDTYESPEMKAWYREWLLEKYCDSDESQVDGWLAGGGKLVLDAGCGSGFSSLLLFGSRLNNNDYLGVDISDSVDIAAERFREQGIKGDFLQANLLDLPIDNGSVDLIFAEGVLHHTDSVASSIARISEKLVTKGVFVFYVYKKKSPVREFTDDYVRQSIADLSDDEAWEVLLPLTKLGAAIGELQATVEVTEDIPLLGIKKGEYDLQRLLYYYVCKMFYRPEFTIEECNHVNFDWFRPQNCHRHTPNEIRSFCDEASLQVDRMFVDESGISVVATRNE